MPTSSERKNRSQPQKTVKRRSQKLEILLDVQGVSCPGAWIPCNGAIHVSLYILGNCMRTRDAAPVFPVKFNEKYLIEKVFPRVFRLSDLDGALEEEMVYVELTQRFADRPDSVLATFETSARDLLFPNVDSTLQFSGADLDLLMEPTLSFKGALPPRLEVSTKTTVKEVRTGLQSDPVAPSSAPTGPTEPPPVPKTLRGRPAFRWRRAEPALLGRQKGAPPGKPEPRRRRLSLGPRPVSRGRHCHCSCPGRRAASGCRSQETGPASSSGGAGALERSRSLEPLIMAVDETPGEPDWCAHCHAPHAVHGCAVCEEYRRYFGRDYPGHQHPDCCNCHCPVTSEGVRHLCGQSRRSRARVPGTPEPGCRATSDSALAQLWQDFVETSSPRKNDKRHDFYERLEDFYRKMYSRASSEIVKGLMQK